MPDEMPKDTVKLISQDGFEFIIDYKAACVSNTIKSVVSIEGSLRICSPWEAASASSQPSA